jgi:hypothetical protein
MDHESNSESHRKRTDDRPHRYYHSACDYHWILGTPKWRSLRNVVADFRNGIFGSRYRWGDVAEATDIPGTHACSILLACILPGRLRFELDHIDDHRNTRRYLYPYSERHLRHCYQNYDGDPHSAVSGLANVESVQVVQCQRCNASACCRKNYECAVLSCCEIQRRSSIDVLHHWKPGGSHDYCVRPRSQ